MARRATLAFISILVLVLLGGCGKKADPLPKSLPVPAGISDLSGQVKDGVLFLSFTTPKKNADGSEIGDLAGFRVMKGCSTCIGDLALLKEIRLDEGKGYTIIGGRLYFYDDDLREEYNYSYRVYPVSRKGPRGEASNVFSIKWRKPPEPPVTASVVVNDGRVELTWSGREGQFYNVYRHSEVAYPLLPVNKEPLPGLSFADTGLENGRRYRYEIRTVIEAEGRKWEGEGFRLDATPKDKTPPSTPLNMKAAKKENTVAVSWDQARESDLAGYDIYRIGDGKKEKLNRELLRDSEYLDRVLPESRYVSYYVTAVDKSGNESEPSREAVVMIEEE